MVTAFWKTRTFCELRFLYYLSIKTNQHFVRFVRGFRGLEILSRPDILLGQLLPFSMAVSPRLRGLVCNIMRNFRIFAAFRVWFSLRISFGASLFVQFK